MPLETIRKGLDFLVGQTNAQQINRYRRDLASVNRLADEMSGLSDAALRDRVQGVRQRMASGEPRGTTRIEVYAAVREVATRQVEMRPFDVQIIGALALDDRKIAEMQTGEGKTLVATLPATLNALSGNVHVVTVNDYLARRDREWMGPIYEAVGLTVGLIQEGMDVEQRKAAYSCDIVYGTNNQFGFDYLRDNMVLFADQKVQGPLDFAIVDEIDNILVDEARTPLIISGSTAESIDRYRKFASLVRRFRREEDFEIYEESRRLTLTDSGIHKGEEALSIDNLYAPQHTETLHHLETALRALHLFSRETDYIVKDGRVMIVDEFTGRLMPDRRYSDGLHQALEAKEGLTVQRESQTLAQITLQHYFQLYRGLCGMTGTAKTEEDEFKQIYALPVLVIPTNRPLIRAAKPDVIYRTEKAKFEAIVDQIAEEHDKGRPILIGTNSIEKSERLSAMLKARKLQHSVLNAKYHEQEAEIVKDAGQAGAITVATNMAGRGTDIKLGEGVAESGGLHVIGCQRHESRRIDNQLLGRAGRQGDPGSSQFFLALEDDLLRIFGGERIGTLMNRLGMEEGEAIEHNLLSTAIRRAQKRVEGRNFEIRKRLLEFDLVMARQREAIYSLRNRFLLPSRDQAELLPPDEFDEYFEQLLQEHAAALIEDYAPSAQQRDEWNLSGLRTAVAPYLNGTLPLELEGRSRDDLREHVAEILQHALARQKQRLGKRFAAISRYLVLTTTDEAWLAHLYTLDDLREGIGWTAYGGTDPLIAFKRESFALFQEMLGRAATKTVRSLLSARLADGGAAPQQAQRNVRFVHPGATPSFESPKAQPAARQPAKRKPTRHGPKIGRNAPCPCGSGKKYKNCCGRAS